MAKETRKMPRPSERAKGNTRFDLNVTQDLIDHAVRGSSASCAVADAIKYQIPDVSHVQVDIQTIRFSFPSRHERLVFLTPRRVQEYIVDFDAGDAIAPFTVQLRNPGVTATKTVIPDETDTPDASLTHRRRKPAQVINDDGKVLTGSGQGIRRIGGRTPPKLATSTQRTFGLKAFRINQAEALPQR
jgi:hypothetical protein